MKAVWSWLCEFVDLPRAVTAEEGASALTAGGLEIEGLVNLGAAFTGVVVAEVVAKRPHPASDKLTLVDVIDGRSATATQVVCGAPNVPEVGRRVLWARPGATLPGGITLATRPVKGIDSPGMLCSDAELGTADDSSGIVVLDQHDASELGAPAQQALGIADWVLDVNVPANRGDCLGHLGLARELAALLGGRLVIPDQTAELERLAAPLSAAELAQVRIDDPDGCRRYVARVIDGVAIGKSPRPLAARLRAVGVRSISNVVDISNYVMFEFGQPLHTFDWHRVEKGQVSVRRARAGERLTTLDGVERSLEPTDLLICDASRPIALAGVMGGQDTEVASTTTRILLESASFDARSIRRTARRVVLLSEASQRFERGVDPALAPLAAARAAVLLAQLGGGRIAAGQVDEYPRPLARVTVPLRLARLRQLTGTELSATDCEGALARLGCDLVAATDGTGWQVTPPSARADLTREVDLIEDVLRVTGYGSVPATLPPLRATPSHLVDDMADRVRTALAAAGLAEAITFGFQHRDRLDALRIPASDRRAHPVQLRNPMSAEQAVMRTSLLPNLLYAVARNVSFGVHDVALFEVGSVFLRKLGQPLDGEPTELLDEPIRVAGALAGQKPRWLGPTTPWDYFDAKGLVEHVVRALGGDPAALRAEAVSDIPYLHPGMGARLYLGDVVLGEVGAAHPAVGDAVGLTGPVYVFDVALAAIPSVPPAQMRAVPRFPASSRDVSLLVDDRIPAARIRDVLHSATEPLLQHAVLIEEYRDAVRLGEHKKSMLWSLVYRADDRTLTDAEVDRAHDAIVARATQEIPAERR